MLQQVIKTYHAVAKSLQQQHHMQKHPLEQTVTCTEPIELNGVRCGEVHCADLTV